MNSKSLTFDEFLPMLATISKQQDPGSYEDFVEVRVLQHFMVLIFFELGTSPLSSGYRFKVTLGVTDSLGSSCVRQRRKRYCKQC